MSVYRIPCRGVALPDLPDREEVSCPSLQRRDQPTERHADLSRTSLPTASHPRLRIVEDISSERDYSALG